jgi:hypothetical protein
LLLHGPRVIGIGGWQSGLRLYIDGRLIKLLSAGRNLRRPLARRNLHHNGLSWDVFPGLRLDHRFIISISTTASHRKNQHQQYAKADSSMMEFPEPLLLTCRLLTIPRRHTSLQGR